MRVRAALCALVVVLVAAPLRPAPAQAEEQVAGTVVRLKGLAVAMQDAMPRVLAVGSQVLVGDVISTGKGARLEVRMLDDSVLTLGARTVFDIIDYVYKESYGNAALRVLSGSFRVVTGKIAKLAGQPFQVAGEVATIGIRGTDFWGGPLDGVFQVVLLGAGTIVITNRAGSVEISEVGNGTKIESADVAPTPPKVWHRTKITRAARSVAFD